MKCNRTKSTSAHVHVMRGRPGGLNQQIITVEDFVIWEEIEETEERCWRRSEHVWGVFTAAPVTEHEIHDANGEISRHRERIRPVVSCYHLHLH